MGDVAILGGSIAGSVSAVELSRRGFRVTLVEKARFPRLKPCGEGLLPHGVRALRELGITPPGTPVRGIRFVAPSGATAARDFPGGHGLVVRRDRFDDFLLRAARSEPGVEFVQGTSAPRARWTIGADGLRSQFHRRAEFAARPRSSRAGFSAHVRGLRVDPERVEVLLFDEGEMYLAPCDGDVLVACLLWEVPKAPSNEARLRRILETHAPDRIDRLEFTTPVLACAPLGLDVRAAAAGDVLLVGDAAGAPDPVTGEGMSLAILSARAAAEALARGDAGSYARARRDLAAGSLWLSSWMLRAARMPETAVRVLAERPRLFARLMEIATGAPLRRLELVRLAI